MDLESNPPTQQWASTSRQLINQTTWFQGSSEQQAHLLTIDAIEALLDGQTSPTEAAHSIADCNKLFILDSSQARHQIQGLWTTITEAVMCFDDQRSGLLADFIIAIHNLPDLLDPNERPVSVAGRVVWRELPDWGWIFGENAIGNIYTAVPSEDWDRAVSCLRNVTTFQASLLARLPDGTFNDCGGMPCNASIALEVGLEGAYGIDEVRKRRLYIPPAIIWLLVAGAKLHELCFSAVPEAMQPVVTARSWHRTFCEERWAFWKQRLLEMGQPPGSDEECRELASRAIARMEDLEGTTYARSPTAQQS